MIRFRNEHLKLKSFYGLIKNVTLGREEKKKALEEQRRREEIRQIEAKR